MEVTVKINEKEIKDGKLTINIPECLMPCFKPEQVELRQVAPGSVVNGKYIVLDHFKNGTTALVCKDILDERFCFDVLSSHCNNWETSMLRAYLNAEYLDKLETEFGENNVIPHTTDLLSFDGDDSYAKCTDKVSLMSITDFQKYNKLLSKESRWTWWLVTPVNSFNGVLCVNTSNCPIIASNLWIRKGIRPFFTLNSSLLVNGKEEKKCITIAEMLTSLSKAS